MVAEAVGLVLVVNVTAGVAAKLKTMAVVGAAVGVLLRPWPMAGVPMA